MSKVRNWQYPDFFQSRKEKLANVLISEIIFLKNKLRAVKDQEIIIIALNKLEYLLNALKNNNSDLSEKEYNKIIKLIYNVFRDITESIDNM